MWICLNQVPLLLSIEEEDSALVKAIESGDTDLVYLVLFHIWEKVLLLRVQAYLVMSLCSNDVNHVSFSPYQSYTSSKVPSCVYYLLLQKPPIDFFGTINARPLARDLFITFARYAQRAL